MDNRRFIARRAAQYFNEGDTVNLGIGIPSACSDYVDPTIAFQTENGMIGVGPVAKKLAICDTYQNAGGINFVPLMGGFRHSIQLILSLLSEAVVMAATVLGALQVAENGDIANWASPGRAFGMGGAMDLCNGARKVIVAMELTTKKGEPKILKKCTYPLTAQGCVNHIVTEQCVIDVTPEGLKLVEIRAGKTPEDIQAQVEPTLIIADDLKVMEEE